MERCFAETVDMSEDMHANGWPKLQISDTYSIHRIEGEGGIMFESMPEGNGFL